MEKTKDVPEVEFVDTKNLLREQMSKMKANRSKIPMADQKGKYKKAFEQLEREIATTLYQLMREDLFILWVRPENKEELRKYVVELLNDKSFVRAVKTCDAEAVFEALQRIRTDLLKRIFTKEAEARDFLSTERSSLDPFNPQTMCDVEGRICIINEKEIQCKGGLT
ncbi:MAG: hypothetical protein K2O59_01655 [Lachnospiraceae bacterium]|nr:hypothetical protein [Lachnospiraceae bacterium]MDE7176496.1 hypothetical protein [Lachnospiraceae bacterium]